MTARSEAKIWWGTGAGRWSGSESGIGSGERERSHRQKKGPHVAGVDTIANRFLLDSLAALEPARRAMSPEERRRFMRSEEPPPPGNEGTDP
jgi:hypothetical protein